MPEARAGCWLHLTAGGRSQILETCGVLDARTYQGRGVWRRYSVLCEVIVRSVGPDAQDVVAVPGIRDGAHWLDVVPAWWTIEGEAGGFVVGYGSDERPPGASR